MHGLTRREDFLTDDIHLNDSGAWLIAMAHYAVLYHRSPLGLPAQLARADGTPVMPPPPDAAAALLKLVWQVVTGYRASGVARGQPMSVFSVLTDVLMVGHSLFGGNLPVLTEEALRQMRGPSVVEAQIINGASLAQNLENSANAEGVDARARLALRPTDALILTEAIPVSEHVKWSDTAGNVARFAKLAHKANPEVRVYLFEGWPARSGEGLPWREQVAQDLPLWLGAAGEGVKIIPAGQALALLEDEIAAGGVPGIDSLDAMFSDEIHLGGKGQYFVAMVIVGAVAGQSPEGLPAKLTRSWANRDAHLTEEQARPCKGWLGRQSWRGCQRG